VAPPPSPEKVHRQSRAQGSEYHAQTVHGRFRQDPMRREQRTPVTSHATGRQKADTRYQFAVELLRIGYSGYSKKPYRANDEFSKYFQDKLEDDVTEDLKE
jgi:hypothetical protein